MLHAQHILTVAQFEREDLNRLFLRADRCTEIAAGERASQVLSGKLLANLFFEPSTRTRLSFGSAFLRLGGAVETTVGVQFSSMAKGETLEDTVRVIDGYADVIVLRHPEVGAARRAGAVAKHPVINAGDGAGEHPTQALLDTYTIERERGSIEGLRIALIGDLKHGRTVHSLARLLTRFEDVQLLLTSPAELAMPQGVIDELRATGTRFECVSCLTDAVAAADVLYVTRLQAERFEDQTQAARFIGSYVVNRALLEKTGRLDATILHPLPRRHDLATDVDDLPGAAYFRQSHLGVPLRMSLFCEVFGVEPN